MAFLGEWRRRIHYLRNREQHERDLEDEILFHLENKAETSGNASAAQRDFGNRTLVLEDSRAVWGWTFLESVAADVGYTLRGFRTNMSFAAIAAGTLALAIGGGTAILSVAEAVLLRPLPYANAGELTLVFEGSIQRPGVPGDTSPGTFRALRENMATLRDLAVFQPNEVNLSGDSEPERLDAVLASANFFVTVGVRPHLGRFFREGEDVPGKDHVVILTYELWQRRFASDPEIVNKSIALNDSSYTVIGVLPPAFRYYLDRGDLWTPFALSPEAWESRGKRYVNVTGRRLPGTSVQQVQSELDALSSRFRQDFPREIPLISLQAVDLRERLTQDSRTNLYFLLTAVLVLLFIACANVANLLLTRAVARSAELSVRRALGASGGRLVRHLLTESLVLALVAGAASLLIAMAAFGALQPLVPPGLLAFTPLHLNWRVIAIQFSLALFCTLASGLLPACRATGLMATRAIGGRHHDKLRGGLIVAEIALAIPLLTTAALLFRTFTNLNNLDPGFQPDHLISAQTVLPPDYYRDPGLRTRFYTSVLERVLASPGVAAAAFTSAIPTTWKGGFTSVTIADKPFEPGSSAAMMRQVTPGYFQTLRISLLGGRVFTADDGAESPRVAVINQAAANRFWPGENVIGKRFRRGNPDSVSPWITVVGVVGDVYEMGLTAKAPAITYFPEPQHPEATFSSPLYVVVRTVGDPAPFASALRRAVHETNPRQSVAKLVPVSGILARESEGQRLNATITVGFAATALFLACLGIYGVLSYSVGQRRQELGLRLALGSSPSQLVLLVLRSGARLIVAGMTIGLGAAAVLTRFIESLLFQVKPLDPVVFAAVSVILGSTALLACWVPARRARAVEPAHALRYQ